MIETIQIWIYVFFTLFKIFILLFFIVLIAKAIDIFERKNEKKNEVNEKMTEETKPEKKSVYEWCNERKKSFLDLIRPDFKDFEEDD